MCRNVKGFLGITRIKHDWHEFHFKDYEIGSIGLRMDSAGCYPEFNERIEKVRVAKCGKIEVYRVSWASQGWRTVEEEEFARVTKAHKLELVPC